jgi:hypothetical protein
METEGIERAVNARAAIVRVNERYCISVNMESMRAKLCCTALSNSTLGVVSDWRMSPVLNERSRA